MVDKERLVEILEKAIAHNVEKPLVREEVPGTVCEHERTIYSKVPNAIKEDLLKIIAQSPDLEVFHDKLFHTGFGAVRVTYEDLAQWLVCRAGVIGTENVVDDLQKHCEMQGTPTYQVLAISGIKVEKGFELANDISLLPFTSAPESWQKNELIRQGSSRRGAMAGFTPPGKEDHLVSPTAALVRKVSISPKSYKQGESPSSPIQAREDLYEVCECLTLVGSSAPVQAGFWGQIEDWVPCSTIAGGGMFATPFSGITFKDNYRFGNGDYALAKNIVSKYLALSQSVRTALRVPLQRLNQCLRNQSHVDRFIDLAISLEALLLHELNDREQIGLVFRLRGAWLLGKDPMERRKYYELFKDIYKTRSQAVHSGKINDKKLKLKIPSGKLVDRGITACVTIIKQIIDQGNFPDWTGLILGGPPGGTERTQ